MGKFSKFKKLCEEVLTYLDSDNKNSTDSTDSSNSTTEECCDAAASTTPVADCTTSLIDPDEPNTDDPGITAHNIKELYVPSKPNVKVKVQKRKLK
jgi:hypothetical protein